MTGRANEIDLATQLTPPSLSDDSGVPLAATHLGFVHLGAQDIADWRARRAPLGMRPGEYRNFCSDLFSAAAADNLPAPSVDVRLKGSAAVVYSGLHKHLPRSWAARFAAFAQAYGRPPSAAERRTLRQSVELLWPWPHRRPFDSMFWLNLERQQSDYDVQVSSGEIERRCVVLRQQPPLAARPLTNGTYGFLDDRLVQLAVPAVLAWANQWTGRLGRTVAVKAFPGTGPPNTAATVGALSSHFRTQDWMLLPPQPTD